ADDDELGGRTLTRLRRARRGVFGRAHGRLGALPGLTRFGARIPRPTRTIGRGGGRRGRGLVMDRAAAEREERGERGEEEGGTSHVDSVSLCGGMIHLVDSGTHPGVLRFKRMTKRAYFDGPRPLAFAHRGGA